MTPFQRRRKLGNILTAVAMGGFFYLVMRYQDTAGFQKAMEFLLTPSADDALPLVWQDHRLFFQAGLVCLAVVFYWPTWRRFNELIQACRGSPAVAEPPNISPLQASYVYCQDLATSMAVWLMTMASAGALLIRFDSGVRPWLLQPGDTARVGSDDRQLLTTLFRRGNSVRLGANLSDPDPEVEETAKTHFEGIQRQFRDLFYPPQTRIMAWLVLAVLIAEIPFYAAAQPTRFSPVLPIALFSAAISFFPAFVIGKYLQRIVMGHVIVPAILFAFSLFFVLVGNHILFSGTNAPPYFSVAFFPSLAVMLMTLVTMMPLTAKDSRLFERILGYHKYLDQDSTAIDADDLPWTIGLDARSDVFGSAGGGREMELPTWLVNDSRQDGRELINQLHQSFTTQVSQAIFGERKTEHRSSLGGGTSMGNRF